MQYFSRYGQDQFLFERFFYGKRNGVFVDVGAGDGRKFSNTLFFERFLDWSGLCIEPSPSAFAKLTATRKVCCEKIEFSSGTQGATKNGILNRIARPLAARHPSSAAEHSPSRPAPTLSSLLSKHGLTQIDYCSIDARYAAPDVFTGLDFDKHAISVFTIDGCDDRVGALLTAKGYNLVGKLQDTSVFKRHDTKLLPQTTVICAVWCGDPARLDLLRGHMANLARQTVPAEAIYVFDGGDVAPAWLDAKAVSVRQPLTIYQAWNVALSLVRTPLVMNLNLDDRLAADAIALMEKALMDGNGCAVGGDWKMCYSQEETDDTDRCYPASRLPFIDEWPPKPGTVMRLGSGTGESGSFGPAVLWRMDAHIGAPRYPWRFMDGTPIRGVGDAAWWKILRRQAHKKLLRLPMIVGNYHSHPGDQAEFRPLAHDESKMLRDIGASLL